MWETLGKNRRVDFNGYIHDYQNFEKWLWGYNSPQKTIYSVKMINKQKNLTQMEKNKKIKVGSHWKRRSQNDVT